MWLSTTKYLFPSFSYTCPPQGEPWMDCAGLLGERLEVEAEVVGGVLGVREHERPVVLVDHPSVMRRHVLLELRRIEVALLLTERLGDVVVDEFNPVAGVHPDHRRQVRHLHTRLLPHYFGDDATDSVVHQRETPLVGRGAVGLVRTLRRCVRRFRRLVAGHWVSSFGLFRLRSDMIPLKRPLARSRPSSKRGGLASGCDHSG